MENNNVNMAGIFQPTDTVITIGDKQVRLVFDMLAFCELEKEYGSVDVVLNMLFGDVAERLEPVVTYNDAFVNIEEIKVDGKPLALLLAEHRKDSRKGKHSDTLNLVWAGMMHDNAIYNDMDEVTGYKIPKMAIARDITFKNYSKINVRIVEAILKDLAPSVGAGETKNVEPQVEEVPPVEKPIQLTKPE